MQWIAPSEKDTASATLEKQLWAAADQLRAIIAKQQALVFQIQNLRQTRDLLLPRLLSGQHQIS
jgi:hypothetical protein